LGRPLGEANGGTPDAEELEAFRSDSSLYLMKSNIQELQNVFTGNYKENTRQIGFDEYLRDLENDALRFRIKDAFTKVNFEIETFDQSLNLTLQNDPEKVLKLKDACSELLVLIKVDMASFIGSIITFNDNDGD